MKFLYLRVVAVLLALALAACSQSSQKPTPKIFDPAVHVWPHDISDVPRDEDVTYGVLENGMRYALQSNARPEQEAVIRLTFRAGSKHESDDMSGGAHFLEHMAFNGTKNVPEGEMVKSLERMGLSFGADTNASTSYTRTDYRLNLPEVDDETVDYALFLLRELSDKMLIEEAAVERERGVVKAEEARRRGPQFDASQAFQKFVQPDARVLKRPVAGTAESLDGITAAKLRRYYETYYRPERAFLVITGDFDVADMEQKIRDNFADWTPKTEDGEDPLPELKTTSGLEAMVYDDDELTTSVTLYAATPPTPSGDSLAERRESMIASAAANIIQMRFSKRLTEANRPVLGAAISSNTGRYINTLSASASAKDNDWKTAIEVLDAEIRRALKYGFQQAELDELIANTRRGLTDSANYAAKRRSGSLTAGITGAFSSGSVRTTPQFSLDNFEEVLPTITVKDLEAHFRKTWDTDFPHKIWVSGPELDDVSEADVIAAYKAARARDIDPPATRQKLDFAYQDFGPAGEIVSRDVVEDMEITRLKFKNNVRLNLKKTDFEDGWIRMQVTVGEGWNRFASEKPGLTYLAGAVQAGGYAAHKASEMSEIFAGKNINLGLNIGTDRLAFSGSTNKDDVLIQLQAWTGLLTAPGYRPEWREKFVESIESSFHTIDSSPGGVAARDLGRIWHDGDVRYGLLPKEDYLALSLEEVRTVLQPLFENGAIEIGIVGDFNEADVIEAVAKTFGALPTRKDSFDPLKEAFTAKFPPADRVTLTHTGEKEQGAIYMGWPIDLPWSVDNSRTLYLLSEVFQNRMTDLIREELGLAYSPSASANFSRPYDGYAYFSASITADPKFFDDFEKAAGKIAADIKAGGISEDELNRARKPVLESFQRAERENGAWLGLVTRAQTEEYKLDWRRARTDGYSAVTTEDLDTLAAKLFTPETLHVVSIVSDRE
jgi:zinc protease